MAKSLHAACATGLLLLLTASAAPQRNTRNITVEGLSFGYVDVGSGTSVILVHGSMSDYREWSAQMEGLAKHHRVIAYSRRYHWPNSPPGKDADATVPRQAEDLAAIIKSLGAAPANIVAHSYGGTVALSLALQHPELVRTLVLLDSRRSRCPRWYYRESEGVAKQRQVFREEMSEAFRQRRCRTYRKDSFGTVSHLENSTMRHVKSGTCTWRTFPHSDWI